MIHVRINMLHLILSRDTNGIIGINNQLLVKIKQDLQVLEALLGTS